MPRIKKATNQLLKEASMQIENVEMQMSLIGKANKNFMSMKSYEV